MWTHTGTLLLKQLVVINSTFDDMHFGKMSFTNTVETFLSPFDLQRTRGAVSELMGAPPGPDASLAEHSEQAASHLRPRLLLRM